MHILECPFLVKFQEGFLKASELFYVFSLLLSLIWKSSQALKSFERYILQMFGTENKFLLFAYYCVMMSYDFVGPIFEVLSCFSFLSKFQQGDVLKYQESTLEMCLNRRSDKWLILMNLFSKELPLLNSAFSQNSCDWAGKNLWRCFGPTMSNHFWKFKKSNLW